MISYAQNFEDVMLSRALAGVGEGFFVDVGAWDAQIDSVTHAFSLRGWRGINVEPLPGRLEALRAARPQDVNLGVALASAPGRRTFYSVAQTGLSTLQADLAQAHAAKWGFAVEALDVEVRRLADVLDQYAPEDIHFLKVDVEEAEAEVLAGADFARHRPWIVLVESTRPTSQEQNFEAWEPSLVSHGYSFVYFDGLNRFYVSDEHAELARHFATPPNVFDGIVSAGEAQALSRLAAIEADLQRRSAAAGQAGSALRARAFVPALIPGPAEAPNVGHLTAQPSRRSLAPRRRKGSAAAVSDDFTPNLDLPYLAAAQAQKHVTMNEALEVLDALVQLTVSDRTTTAPPASPVEGGRVIIGSPASGGWTGREGQVAAFRDGAWSFHAPREGWRAFVESERIALVFSLGVWSPLAAVLGPLDQVPAIGIGAASQPGAPLLARLNTALLTAKTTAEGGAGDVRLTLNKEAAGKVASVLMQTAYGGRAEVGLLGDDRLSLKMSGDGAAWATALTVGADTRVGVGSAAAPAGALDVRGPLKVGDSSMGDVLAFGDAGAESTGCGVYLARRNAAGSGPGAVMHIGGYDGVCFHVGDTPGAPGAARFKVTNAVVTALPVTPAVDNAVALGSGAMRFSTAYLATSPVTTSDGREKEDVRDAELGLDFVRALRPRSFRWAQGGQTGLDDGTVEVRPGRRRHHGFVAQEVAAVLDEAGVRDFAGLVETEEGRLGLRYEQFIPALTGAVAELASRVEALEARLAAVDQARADASGEAARARGSTPSAPPRSSAEPAAGQAPPTGALAAPSSVKSPRQRKTPRP